MFVQDDDPKQNKKSKKKTEKGKLSGSSPPKDSPTTSLSDSYTRKFKHGMYIKLIFVLYMVSSC